MGLFIIIASLISCKKSIILNIMLIFLSKNINLLKYFTKLLLMHIMKLMNKEKVHLIVIFSLKK